MKNKTLNIPESWPSAIRGYKNYRRWNYYLDNLRKARTAATTNLPKENDNGDYLASEAKASSYDVYLNEKIMEMDEPGNENNYDVPVPGLNLIKEFEGFRSKAYVDPLSHNLPITIGWGSTKKQDGSNFELGDVITRAEADELLAYQCSVNYLPILSEIPFWKIMSDGQKGALLSFAYNLGAHFYGSKNFATITKVLKNKEWSQVPAALYLYRNPGSNVERGLAHRRIVEGKVWKSSS